jgi:hypothetical protein
MTPSVTPPCVINNGCNSDSLKFADEVKIMDKQESINDSNCKKSFKKRKISTDDKFFAIMEQRTELLEKIVNISEESVEKLKKEVENIKNGIEEMNKKFDILFELLYREKNFK